jgi:hypothetical protein
MPWPAAAQELPPNKGSIQALAMRQSPFASIKDREDIVQFA